MKRKCIVCGEDFLVTRPDRIYCSDKCRSTEHNKKTSVEKGAHLCKKCGKPKEEERQSGKFKFCYICQKAEKDSKKPIPTKKACEWCGKAFETIHNGQKYCSAECGKEMYKVRMYKTERVLVCGWCEKEFVSMRKKTYCSNECRYEANGRKRKQTAKSKKTKPKFTLAQVNAMARAEGLSYGQYMAKYSL